MIHHLNIISALELKLQLRRPMTALVEQGIMPQYKVKINIFLALSLSEIILIALMVISLNGLKLRVMYYEPNLLSMIRLYKSFEIGFQIAILSFECCFCFLVKASRL